MTEFSIVNINSILPEIFMVVAAMLLLVWGAFKGNEYYAMQMKLVRLIFLCAAVLTVLTPPVVQVTFGGMFLNSGFTVFVKMLILGGSYFSLHLASGFYRENKKIAICEFPVLVLLAATGMMVVVSANNLLMLYMGLELQSLALYVLASVHRDNLKSSEAGLKYFVLGSLSSGIILYGSSLIYGFSGTIGFDELRELYAASSTLPAGVLIGLVFVITGVCFKLSAVPFHMWTPDVYEGSPTPVTAFFAVAPKVAAAAVIIRLLMHPFVSVSGQWQQIIIFVSAASMIVGALGAMQQTNIKRLLAYSSIGHVGYILVGLAAASNDGVKAILMYLAIYVTLSLGMFACIMMIKRKDGKSEDISSFSGLSKSNPLMALAVAVIMFSMAGIPPFAGFFGKFFIFLAAIENGLYVLAVIGVLSSVIAAFYYLRIVKIMYLDEPIVSLDKERQTEMKFIACAAAIFNLLFLAFITPVLNLSESAANWLF